MKSLGFPNHPAACVCLPVQELKGGKTYSKVSGTVRRPGGVGWGGTGQAREKLPELPAPSLAQPGDTRPSRRYVIFGKDLR